MKKIYTMLFLACILALVGCKKEEVELWDGYSEGNQYVSAPNVYTEPVSKEAMEQAIALAVDMVPSFAKLDSEASGAEFDPELPIYLGNGYYTYYLKDRQLTKRDSVDIPIIQDGVLKAFIVIGYDEASQLWWPTITSAYAAYINAEVCQGGMLVDDGLAEGTALYYVTNTKSSLLLEDPYQAAQPEYAPEAMEVPEGFVLTSLIEGIYEIPAIKE